MNHFLEKTTPHSEIPTSDCHVRHKAPWSYYTKTINCRLGLLSPTVYSPPTLNGTPCFLNSEEGTARAHPESVGPHIYPSPALALFYNTAKSTKWRALWLGSCDFTGKRLKVRKREHAAGVSPKHLWQCIQASHLLQRSPPRIQLPQVSTPWAPAKPPPPLVPPAWEH